MRLPIVSVKQHNQLRESYRQLLMDNAKLSADNRRLRKRLQEVQKQSQRKYNGER